MGRSVRHSRKTPAPRTTRGVARIDALGAAGDGIALIDGKRVYVPLTAPGDVVEVVAQGERGELLSLIERGLERIDPPCRHFGACGGCSLQHLTPQFQRGWKRARVIEALAREGLPESAVGETIETPEASRRRATFAARISRGRLTLGFNARRSAEIVDVAECRILHAELHARLPGLRKLAGAVGASSFDLAVTLCDNGIDVAVVGKTAPQTDRERAGLIAAAQAAGVVRLTLNGETLAQFATPVVSFGGKEATPHPGAFLQASREGEAALIALVKNATQGARKIADLFCGCGTFALPLAAFATVCAYDSDRAAVDALRRASAEAQRAGIRVNPVAVEARDLFERPLSAKELKSFDAIVFDPPRAGAQAQAVEIGKSGVGSIVAVSCNPATFARDAAILVQAGYKLLHATPVDQFVHSPHVEVVGVFRRD